MIITVVELVLGEIGYLLGLVCEKNGGIVVYDIKLSSLFV